MARNVISRRLEDDFREVEAATADTGKTVRDLVEARRTEIEQDDRVETALLAYIVLAIGIGACAWWADASTVRIVEIEAALAVFSAGIGFLLCRTRSRLERVLRRHLSINFPR